jgi:hypothetical protein
MHPVLRWTARRSLSPLPRGCGVPAHTRHCRLLDLRSGAGSRNGVPFSTRAFFGMRCGRDE